MSPLSICNIFERTEMRNAYDSEKVVSFVMNEFSLKWHFIEESKNANSYVYKRIMRETWMLIL